MEWINGNENISVGTTKRLLIVTDEDNPKAVALIENGDITALASGFRVRLTDSAFLESKATGN